MLNMDFFLVMIFSCDVYNASVSFFFGQSDLIKGKETRKKTEREVIYIYDIEKLTAIV